jgi:hypothetical protein
VLIFNVRRLIVFELTSNFPSAKLINKLSKGCTLNYTNMLENTEQRENKDVSRWMINTNLGITHRLVIL